MQGSSQLALACDELALWLDTPISFLENGSGKITNKAQTARE